MAEVRRVFIDHADPREARVFRVGHARVRVLVKQEVAGERLPVVHGFFADGQKLFEFTHADTAFLSRPQFRTEDDAGDVHVCRAIDSAFFQFVEEVVEQIHGLRIELDGAVLFMEDKIVFMVVETDGVVADTEQPFGQFFALRLWIDLSR